MPEPWVFAEFTPVGVDLSSPSAVRDYDRNQGTDEAADRALLRRLGIGAGTRLVDLACGTGSFVVQAALVGADVSAVDVSEQMLDYTGARATAAGVPVRLHHAGFLSYAHEGRQADVVTTKSALHQLPDFWKQAALLNIAEYLRPGGLLYIWDLMFSFPPAEYPRHLRGLLDEFGRTDGSGFSRADFEVHLREEFSTYTWILAGLLERAGFELLATDFPRPTHGEFLCRRS